MRTEVVGRQIDITPSIREHAEQKAEKLLRFFDGVQQIEFTITQQTSKGDEAFDVELVVAVTGHDDFVCHAKHADLYAAIDGAVQKGSRSLAEHKDRVKQHKS
ncbi:MAG: ribosome-associated translation inhibitor RaiA [Planctomycetota bacterium]